MEGRATKQNTNNNSRTYNPARLLVSPLFVDGEAIDNEEDAFEAIRRQGKSTTMDLKFTQLSQPQLDLMVTVLGKSTTVTSLDLWACGLTYKAIPHIASAINLCKTIVTVDIGSNTIGDIGAEALLSSLPHWVRNLSISKANLTDESGPVIANFISSASCHLEVLDLRSNSLGDKTAKRLAEALRSNNTLTKLILFHNNISNAGGYALADSIKQCPSLTYVDLRMNLISSSRLASLTDIKVSGSEVFSPNALVADTKQRRIDQDSDTRQHRQKTNEGRTTGSDTEGVTGAKFRYMMNDTRPGGASGGIGEVAQRESSYKMMRGGISDKDIFNASKQAPTKETREAVSGAYNNPLNYNNADLNVNGSRGGMSTGRSATPTMRERGPSTTEPKQQRLGLSKKDVYKQQYEVSPLPYRLALDQRKEDEKRQNKVIELIEDMEGHGDSDDDPENSAYYRRRDDFPSRGSLVGTTDNNKGGGISQDDNIVQDVIVKSSRKQTSSAHGHGGRHGKTQHVPERDNIPLSPLDLASSGTFNPPQARNQYSSGCAGAPVISKPPFSQDYQAASGLNPNYHNTIESPLYINNDETRCCATGGIGTSCVDGPVRFTYLLPRRVDEDQAAMPRGSNRVLGIRKDEGSLEPVDSSSPSTMNTSGRTHGRDIKQSGSPPVPEERPRGTQSSIARGLSGSNHSPSNSSPLSPVPSLFSIQLIPYEPLGRGRVEQGNGVVPNGGETEKNYNNDNDSDDTNGLNNIPDNTNRSINQYNHNNSSTLNISRHTKSSSHNNIPNVSRHRSDAGETDMAAKGSLSTIDSEQGRDFDVPSNSSEFNDNTASLRNINTNIFASDILAEYNDTNRCANDHGRRGNNDGMEPDESHFRGSRSGIGLGNSNFNNNDVGVNRNGNCVNGGGSSSGDGDYAATTATPIRETTRDLFNKLRRTYNLPVVTNQADHRSPLSGEMSSPKVSPGSDKERLAHGSLNSSPNIFTGTISARNSRLDTSTNSNQVPRLNISPSKRNDGQPSYRDIGSTYTMNDSIYNNEEISRREVIIDMREKMLMALTDSISKRRKENNEKLMSVMGDGGNTGTGNGSGSGSGERHRHSNSSRSSLQHSAVYQNNNKPTTQPSLSSTVYSSIPYSVNSSGSPLSNDQRLIQLTERINKMGELHERRQMKMKEKERTLEKLNEKLAREYEVVRAAKKILRMTAGIPGTVNNDT